MYFSKSLTLSTTLMISARAVRMDIRDTSDAVADSNIAKVCYPEVGDSAETIPPCLSIVLIESICQPNGTEIVDFDAYAQCMCGGSYFMDWRGCQDCLFVHGFRSARDHVYWEGVLAVASDALCHSQPTAAFQALFASAQANTRLAPFPTAGATETSDEFPSQTAVSLYYTASGPQCPGDCATATATYVPVPSSGNLTAGRMSVTGENVYPTRIGPVTSSHVASASPSTSSSPGATVTRGIATAMALAIAGVGATFIIAF